MRYEIAALSMARNERRLGPLVTNSFDFRPVHLSYTVAAKTVHPKFGGLFGGAEGLGGRAAIFFGRKLICWPALVRTCLNGKFPNRGIRFDRRDGMGYICINFPLWKVIILESPFTAERQGHHSAFAVWMSLVRFFTDQLAATAQCG